MAEIIILPSSENKILYEKTNTETIKKGNVKDKTNEQNSLVSSVEKENEFYKVLKQT